MTINARQIRTAQHMLGWTSAELAERSRVGFATVLRVQQDTGPKIVSGMDLWAIRRAFEAAGVEFISEANGSAGIQRRIPLS